MSAATSNGEPLNERLLGETQALIRSWAQYDAAWLQDYLVQGVEDPRTNPQSLLTRHFLIGRVAPGRCDELKLEELRFSVVLNWLRQVAAQPGGWEDLQNLGLALERGADNVDGLAIPAFVRLAFRQLPKVVDGLAVPNYVRGATSAAEAEALAGTFLGLWNQALGALEPGPEAAGGGRPLRVLELACGSANDYRYFPLCGLARHLDFSGLDLCVANIDNARRQFPNVDFRVGNALGLPYPEATFAVAFVHDLFEHLSLEGLERALDELGRVTREALCLGFFRVHEGPEHQVQPVDEYHLNGLSLHRLREGLGARGFRTQAIHLGTFLRELFGVSGYHNPQAYTLVAERT